MDGIIAQRYAVSLFEVGCEENVLENISEELVVLGEIFSSNAEFFKILSTPVVTKQDKDELITKVFGDKLSLYTLNFVRVLTEKGRITEFPQIIKSFRRLYNQKNNIGEVTAITAIPLSDDLFNKLKSKLEQITGKSIILFNTVDTTILGGVVLQMDDDQMDGSILNRLNSLRTQISANIA